MGVRVAFLDAAAASGSAPAGAPAAPPGVLVPATAVSVSGSSGTVYVVHDGHAELRTVHVGQARGQDLEVLSGISAGEQVAVGERSRLSDGAPVRVLP